MQVYSGDQKLSAKNALHLSKRIFFAKISFIIITIIILAVMIGYSMMKPERVMFPRVQNTTDVTEPKMINPHFQGVDDQNQPYNITAERATQHDANNIELHFPQGDISLKDGSWVTVIAKQAFLTLPQMDLDLKTEVKIFSDQGYEFHTNSAFMNLSKRTAYGDEVVTAQGLVGNLEARGFTFDAISGTITFKGPVKMKIYMQ